MLSIALSIGLMAPTQHILAAESFSDAQTGFALRLPQGFDVGNRRNDPNHDVLVDIVSRTGQPPAANPSEAICAAGFKRNPPDFDQTLEDLNSPAAMQYMATAIRGAFAGQGLDVQTVDQVDRADVAGLELTMIPPAGPDHRNVRIYIAILDRPVGRADLICATTRDALPTAITTFRDLARGIDFPPGK